MMRRDGESMRHYAVRLQVYEEFNQDTSKGSMGSMGPGPDEPKKDSKGSKGPGPIEPKLATCYPLGVRVISPDDDSWA